NFPLKAPYASKLESERGHPLIERSVVSPCPTTLAGTTILFDKRQGGTMYIREQRQQNPVADEVLALTAVVRPVLPGTLDALKNEVVSEAGGFEGVKLLMLPRLYKAGDGDCGICFEYAVQTRHRIYATSYAGALDGRTRVGPD